MLTSKNLSSNLISQLETLPTELFNDKWGFNLLRPSFPLFSTY